jgi:hypothetical protein
MLFFREGGFIFYLQQVYKITTKKKKKKKNKELIELNSIFYSIPWNPYNFVLLYLRTLRLLAHNFPQVLLVQ